MMSDGAEERVKTAVTPVDAIQTAYNNAVVSGRIALAREVAQLWITALAEQKGQKSIFANQLVSRLLKNPF